MEKNKKKFKKILFNKVPLNSGSFNSKLLMIELNCNSSVRKFFIMKYYILITLLICALCGAVFIYSPQQAETSPHIRNTLPQIAEIPREEQQSLYQYAAPWNTQLYENLYIKAIEVPTSVGPIKGSIVPHHLLGGHLTASLLKYLEQQLPSTIVLIGPNHFDRGRTPIISSQLDWKTPFGTTKAARKLLYELEQKNIIHYDEETIKEEHSIYSIVSFINKSLPNTKIAPFIIKNTATTQELNNLVTELTRVSPPDTVFISSIDFSHYQNYVSANFHDEYTQNLIKTADLKRLPLAEIDSTPSLYVLMKLMEHYKSQKVAFELGTNSAELTNNLNTRETTSYYSPYFVEGTPIPSNERAISMLFFGDMMLDRSVARHIKEVNADSIFEKLAGQENRFFRGMDIVSANLEGPFGNTRRPTTKSIAFNFNPELISTLKKYNFNILNLANNHSYDMGRQAFEETKENLQTANIEFYGEQYSIDENALLIKQISNKKVAFIGLNDTNRQFSISEVEPLITQAKKNADLVVVNIHWGQEYQLNSHPRQQYLAHTLIDSGVDIIIGHHPHVIQEIEVYKNRPIFYSLGNFVFDQYFSQETQQGLGVGIIANETTFSIYLFPLKSEKSEVSLMQHKQAEQLIERILPKEYTNDINKINFNFKINL